MTTPPQPTPAGEKPIGQFLRPLRDLAVYALAGLPAVLLFVAVIDLFGTDFVGRTRYSFGSFVNLVTIFFPLAAVLLALVVKPVHPKARLIVLAALIEYGVVAFFGLVFGVLFGISGIASDDPGAARFLVQRSPSPQIVMKLLFLTGSASDPQGKEGLAQLAAKMVVEAGSDVLVAGRRVSLRVGPEGLERWQAGELARVVRNFRGQ